MARAKDPHTSPHPVHPGRTVSGRMMPTNKEMAPKASGPKPSLREPKTVPTAKGSSTFSSQGPRTKPAAKGKRKK